MPRIYGFISEEATGSPQQIGFLSSRLASVSFWNRQEVVAGNACIGCIGPRSGLVRSGRCIAVVDGYFCNRNDLPAGPDDATRLILLYERHGFENALNKIAGDFTVALYDSASDELWLGRDRAGARPCYFAPFTDGIAFASRPGVLLGLPGVSSCVSRSYVALFAASHYRTIDNNPHGSPYDGVRQLPAAHLACVHRGRVAVRRWWNLSDQPEFECSEDELAERYRELLLTAVGERLRIAEKPAFSLSGGMDSSSVLATAVHLQRNRQHAFSSVYADRSFDESEEIATMLDAAVEEWHPVHIDSFDVVDCVSDMIVAHDEPVATATWLSHWLICKAVAEAGFDSLFGGLGGDELNAGEYEYFFFHFADLRAAGREAELSWEMTCWAQHHDHPVWRKNRAVAEEALGRLVNLDRPGQCWPDRRRIMRYAATLNADFFDIGCFEPAMDSPFTSYLKNRTYQDIFRETAPCCLRAEDRQTHAFGLHNIDPFYDHRLMEFMFRIPGRLKIRAGVTKYLLRRAMQGLVPEATRTRVKKCGWNAPAHLWFSGKGKELLLDMVLSKKFSESGIYHLPEVLRIIDEHDLIVSQRQEKENHMMFLWQLVNLHLWLTMPNDRYTINREAACPVND
jgi:asparagine synthase (glutamine-hydrolysing)